MSGVDRFLEAHHQRFGHVSPTVLAVKLAEEAGEVAGEVYRQWEQPALASSDGFAGLRAELGDLVLVAAVLAHDHGWSLCDLVDDRAETVVRRWAGISDDQQGLMM